MKGLGKVVVCAIAAITISSQVSVSALADDARVAEGIRYHDEARLKPADNLAKAKEILGSLEAKSPLARGYYGSAITMEASVCANEKKYMKSLSLLKEGVKYIDSAIKDAPELADLRFIRMINSYELSVGSPVKRFKEMKADIDWFDQRLDRFNATERGEILLYKGLYFVKAHQDEEATKAFDACIAASPGSKEATEAQKQLASLAE